MVVAAAEVSSVVVAMVIASVMVMVVTMIMVTTIMITAGEVLARSKTMRGRQLMAHLPPVTRFSRSNVVGVEVRAIAIRGVRVTDEVLV